MCIAITFPCSEVLHNLFFRVLVVCCEGNSLQPTCSSGISICRADSYSCIHMYRFQEDVGNCHVCGCPLTVGAPGLMLSFVIGCASVWDLTPPLHGMRG